MNGEEIFYILFCYWVWRRSVATTSWYSDQYTDLRYLEGVRSVGFPTENFPEWREKFIEKICDFPDKVSVGILYVLLSMYE